MHQLALHRSPPLYLLPVSHLLPGCISFLDRVSLLDCISFLGRIAFLNHISFNSLLNLLTRDQIARSTTIIADPQSTVPASVDKVWQEVTASGSTMTAVG